MKRLLTVLIASALLAAPLSAGADSPGDARTSLISGNVYLTAADTSNKWQTVSINMPVMQGDTYWVAQDARAEIQFNGSSYLRADGGTEFQVTSLDSASNTVTINLQTGRAYVDYENIGQGSFFEVDTPMVSIDANQDAQFDITVNEGGVTEVSVVSGSVDTNAESGSTAVGAGNMVSFSKSGMAVVSSYTPDDAWMQWNSSRNLEVAQNSGSAAYLPPSLADYGYDFDNYGNWEYVATYGYVWTPIMVTSGWAPFSMGSWMWMGGNYVWISSEPWGWVPYHYGRWAYRAGLGWFWVPPARNQAFWCPGAVAWTYTPDYVSWVPLAPGETYYGYGNYGPHSVNLRNGAPPMSHRQIIYANSRVTNAVSVVSRQMFDSGSAYRRLKIPENPFMQAKYSVIQKPPERNMFTQPGQQFRQVTPPGLPANGNRTINRPQQPGHGFRLMTPLQAPTTHNSVIAPRQQVQQFRQVTQPQMQFRQFNNFSSPPQPAQQFRSFNNYSRPQQQVQQSRQTVQPQTQFRQFDNFSPSQQPVQQFSPFNNSSQQQAPAFRTQFQGSGNTGPSGPVFNRSSGSDQSFRR